MGADKSKKTKLAEETDEDKEIAGSIRKVLDIQDEIEKINEEEIEKALEVKHKYNEVRKPVYDKRNDIIKSVPEFWLIVFLRHPRLGPLLTEEDRKIFKYLSELKVEYFKDVKSGYSIMLNFNSNPYFEDSKLTKTFSFLEDGTKKITATSIKWKEGMCIESCAPEEKGKKRCRAEESFFTWFSDRQSKGDFDESHDEIADIIKDDLWPNPFTNFDNEDDEEVGDAEDDEEADEENVEVEDDDEDDEHVSDMIRDDVWPNPLAYFSDESDEEDNSDEDDEDNEYEDDEDDEDTD